jgi:hypothetical protein
MSSSLPASYQTPPPFLRPSNPFPHTQRTDSKTPADCPPQVMAPRQQAGPQGAVVAPTADCLGLGDAVTCGKLAFYGLACPPKVRIESLGPVPWLRKIEQE